MPEKPTPEIPPQGIPEKSQAIHRDNLEPRVRKYADNLRTQILSEFESLGVGDMDEFADQVAQGSFPEATIAKVEALTGRLIAATEKNSIPELPESTLEKQLSLKEQYDQQVERLHQLGLIQEQSQSKELGITGIDGKEYLLPSYLEVQERLQAREADLTRKAEQGFTKLLIVPFGRKLLDLKQIYEEQILRHHLQGKLFGANGDPLDLDTTTPLFFTDHLFATKPLIRGRTVAEPDKTRGADESGELVYLPKTFDKNNHGGAAKRDLIAANRGFDILLLEQDLAIPRAVSTQIIGGRKRLEANKTPNEYLGLFSQGTATYEHESGFTPEDWLTLAIDNLETNNQALDDFQAKDQFGKEFTSISYLIGAFHPAAGKLADGGWGRGAREASLDWSVPHDQDASIGARSAVRV